MFIKLHVCCYQDDNDLFGDRSFDAERYSGATPSMERKALENELRYMREPLMSQEDFIDKTGSTNTMTIPFAEERFKKSKVNNNLRIIIEIMKVSITVIYTSLNYCYLVKA